MLQMRQFTGSLAFNSSMSIKNEQLIMTYIWVGLWHDKANNFRWLQTLLWNWDVFISSPVSLLWFKGSASFWSVPACVRESYLFRCGAHLAAAFDFWI